LVVAVAHHALDVVLRILVQQLRSRAVERNAPEAYTLAAARADGEHRLRIGGKADHVEIRVGEFVDRAPIVTFFDPDAGLLIFAIELDAPDDHALPIDQPIAREPIAFFDDTPSPGERIDAQHRA
jgi:hypothetical protein